MMDSSYSNLLANECGVITCLLSSMEEKVNYEVLSLNTPKKVWSTLKEVYDNKKNIFRIFELYDYLFTL